MDKTSLYICFLAGAITAGTAVYAIQNNNATQPVATAGKVSESEVVAILEKNPQIVVNAMQKFEQQKREAEERAAAKLFMDNLDELHNDPDTPYVGPKDAEVVLVEFFDFNCGYCKKIANTMETIIKNNPDIKVVFKPATFLGSKPIALAAVAANEQGKFLELYKAFLTAPGRLDEAKINEIVEKAGLDMDKFKADVASEKVNKIIEKSAALGNKVQIRGVPSLILNGKKLNTVDLSAIQAAIDNLK